jgi:predicted ArsR family transcriptional regulator
MEKRAHAGGPKRGVGKTRAMILRLTLEGYGVRDIAIRCGISTQAVNQHLRRLRDDGDLDREGAA